MLDKFCKNPCLHAEAMNRAAKKSHTEANYRSLTDSEKKQFSEAKRRELKCWIETNTVEPIPTQNTPNKDHVIEMGLDLEGRSIFTNGRKPKARLVIRGFQDPEVGIVSTESLTLSRDGRMMILQTVSSLNWGLQSFDIKTAFLRGRSDQRELAIYPVPEFQEMLNRTKEQVF